MVAGMGRVPDDPCAIARSLGVLGERWTFLIPASRSSRAVMARHLEYQAFSCCSE
jgi:hypothetical protein